MGLTTQVSDPKGRCAVFRQESAAKRAERDLPTRARSGLRPSMGPQDVEYESGVP